MRIATDHRPAILRTAARLFARRPFHEVLMDDVAAEAGVAKGTIYRHYPNKEALFAALGLAWLDSLKRTVAASAHGTGDCRSRLREMVRRTAEHYRQHSDLFQVMQHHECILASARYADFLKRREHIRDRFAAVLRQGQAAGEIHGLECHVAADLILGMLRSLLRFGDPHRSPEAIADIVAGTLLDGIGLPARTTFRGPRPAAPISLSSRKIGSRRIRSSPTRQPKPSPLSQAAGKA